jgi:dTDP-4-amino-4,6-dideoxygalactose transaminase
MSLEVSSGRSSEIAINDLSVAGRPLENEIRAAIERVLRSGRFILGPEGEALESELSRAFDAGHAVGVANGTDAITLSLLALGVGAGDEVVTSPLTAAFTALAVSRAGAKPVFADVEPDTLTLSAESVSDRITSRTRAILPVHLYGNACDMEAILGLAGKHSIPVVEDACQAHGGRLGTAFLGSLSELGTFSFYPTKNLGALGDGGMVVTRDETLAAKVRSLRNGGQSSRYVHDDVGFNSRLDEIQAAVLRVRLRHLESENERRRELARLYESELRGAPVEPVAVRKDCVSARHLFVVRAPSRDGLAEHLKSRGIQTLVHFPIATHLQPAYKDLGLCEGSCPVAEKAASEVLSLPLYPALSIEDVSRVARAVRDFY